jgi:hypothetical protein
MNLGIEYRNTSKSILLFVLIVYVLDFITGNKLSDIFILNTSDILVYQDLWKIITYPLKYNSSASLLLFTFVFLFLSSNLENFYKFSVVPIFYLLITASHGVLISLFNITETTSFISGTDGVAFFVLVLHYLLFKNYRFYVLNFELILTKYIILTIIGTWAFLQGLNYFLYTSSEVFNSFLLAGLGTSNALIVYYQMYFIKKYNDKKYKSRIIDKVDEEEPSLEMISASKLKMTENKRVDDVNLISSDPIENEERMNNILEKITDSGYSSLSESEQKFLEEYSKNIS